MELFFKEIHCKLIDNEHTFLLGLLLSFFIGDFFFLNFDVVFFCKVSQRFGIAHVLYLHDKVHWAASFSTAKAFAEPFCAGNIE